MYLVVKDHKEVKEGEIPKTRPIVFGCRPMGVHLSEALSDIIEGLASSLENSIEVISREDLLAVVNAYNASLGNREEITKEDLILIGIDVKALFPSLDPVETAKVIRQEYFASEFNVEGTSWQELSRYIAMNLTVNEIRARSLHRISAKRTYTMGRRPGCTSAEALGPHHGEELHES